MNVHPSFLAKRRKPRFNLPSGATDTHCHVFGPGDVFPYASNRRYTPADAPKEMLRALHDHLGIGRAVIVQASCHGTDNRAMLDCIASDPKRYRGVAIVDDGFTDEDYDTLDAGGVRGVRFNFVKHLGGAPDMGVFNRVIDRIKGRGWHVVLHLDAPSIVPLSAMMRALPVPFIVDHMGRVPRQGRRRSAAAQGAARARQAGELLDQGVRRRAHLACRLTPRRCRSRMRSSRRRRSACSGAPISRIPTPRTRPTRPIWSIWCRNLPLPRWRNSGSGGQSGPALWFRLIRTRNAKFRGGSR